MNKKSKLKEKKFQKRTRSFRALNDYVQVLPDEADEMKGEVYIANPTKQKPSRGKVISVGEGRYLPDGTLIKPPVKAGDIIAYNPHMINPLDLKDEEGRETLLLTSNAVYGIYE